MTIIEQLESARTSVLAYIAEGKFNRRSVQIGDQRVEFTSFQSAEQALKRIERLIAEYSGSFQARTYAQNDGRGFVGGCRR